MYIHKFYPKLLIYWTRFVIHTHTQYIYIPCESDNQGNKSSNWTPHFFKDK